MGSATYKTQISCSQPERVLREVMESAVDRYLSLQPKVFPIDRQSMSIGLKVQKSYRSSGEVMTIAIDKEAFSVTSKCIL